MRKRTIFIVMADTMYEGSDPVRGFDDKADAEAFAQRCRDHEAKHRNSPHLDAPEIEWEKWQRHDRSWAARHPAGPYSGRYTYTVLPLPIVPATTS